MCLLWWKKLNQKLMALQQEKDNLVNDNAILKAMAKKASEQQVEYQHTKRPVLHSHPVEDKTKISSLRGKLVK